jgi:hypothetical protein
MNKKLFKSPKTVKFHILLRDEVSRLLPSEAKKLVTKVLSQRIKHFEKHVRPYRHLDYSIEFHGLLHPWCTPRETYEIFEEAKEMADPVSYIMSL